MEEEKTLLKICLGVIALLIVVGAVWRVLSYRQNTARKIHTPADSVKADFIVNNPAASRQDMVALLEEPASKQVVENVPAPSPIPSSFSSYKFAPSSAVSYPKNRATAKQAYTRKPSTDKRYVNTNFYDTNIKPLSSQVNPTDYHFTEYSNPQVNFHASSTDRMREERTRALAPYLRPNQQDKTRMDAQWDKLAAGLQRAIAKALMPKSKREEMIEKYAANSGETQIPERYGLTGQFAPVGQQLAAQKQLMMQQMGQAFGGVVAQQVGEIMDSFAGEVGSTLNSPNSTAQQKEQQIRELTKKYQDKMDKLAEKSQYDKFVAQRTAEMNEQKEVFRSQYGAELGAQLSKNLEEEWQEEQKLATQNLPMDEYNTSMAQLHQAKRNERQQLVVAQGKSINPLLELEKQREEKALKELKEKVANGEVESIARKATVNEMQQMQTDLKVKSQDTLDRIAKDPLLGPQAAEEFKPILDNYQTRLTQLYQQELPIDERQEQETQLLKGVNRQLLDKQIEYVEKSNLPEAQKQKILEDLSQAYNSI